LVPSVEKLLDKKTIEKRYDQINDFEKMLEDNGTTIVKFYLNISKEKQKDKLNERLTDPTKYWKHNIGDWDTRDNYDEYMDIYEKIFAKCDKPERHIIAADQNRYKIYQICKVLVKVFEEMELRRPKLSPDQETSYLKAKAELAERRDEKELAKEKAKEERKLAKKLAKNKAKEEKKAKKLKAKADKKAAKEKAKLVKEKAKNDKKIEIKAAKEKAKLAKEKAKNDKKVEIKTPAKKTTSITKTPTPIKKPTIKATTATSKSTLIKTPVINKSVTNK
jgi:phage-related minor tail protein